MASISFWILDWDFGLEPDLAALLSGFFFTDVEFFPVLAGVALALAFVSSDRFFPLEHTSSDDAPFFNGFRGAFGVDEETSFRADCLFLVFGGVTFNRLHINVIESLTQRGWFEDFDRTASREKFHDKIVGDAQVYFYDETTIIVRHDFL